MLLHVLPVIHMHVCYVSIDYIMLPVTLFIIIIKSKTETQLQLQQKQ